MRIIGWLLRLYAFLFHLPLALFFLGVGLVAATSGQHNLKLAMLPWTEKELSYWLLGLSLTGLIVTVLAAVGRLRPLFALWALYVFCQAFYGYFLSNYWIGSPEDMRWALLFTFGALLAFAGAVVHARAGSRSKRRERFTDSER